MYETVIKITNVANMTAGLLSKRSQVWADVGGLS